MLPLLLFIAFAAARAQDCTHEYDGATYNRRVIFKTGDLPTNLAYHPQTKDLHFTLIDVATLQSDNVQTKMEQYVWNDNVTAKISSVNGQAAAVDVKNDKVYLASDNGLYAYDDNETQLLGLKDQDIVQIFKPSTGDEIYAVLFPDSEVYSVDLNNYKLRRIENVPCAFIMTVDSHGNIFYECDSKYVKVLLKNFHEPIEFVGIAKNSARALTVDDKDRVILAANDGLYWLKPDSIVPAKLMNLDFVPSGISVGYGGFYLSTNGHIFQYIKC